MDEETYSSRSSGDAVSNVQVSSMDRLKGFTHLETFDKLQQWAEDDIDPLQRANTPLFVRPNVSDTHNAGKSKTMLIHDYIGGYNDYEACQGAVVDKEMYSCEYLQYVETFVYFSHKLVTVPPPTWINTCHRNGVKVLGTFIVEPGSSKVELILEEVEGRFWVAEQLVRIARYLGFDGWLVNIEASFPLLSWSVEKLERFLQQLRQDMGSDGKVVWYDALTTLNFVWSQNTLNSLNLQFALAAGSMLTNYAWTPGLAKRGQRVAEQSRLGAENLCFGIDVWAQNVQKGPHPRVTWPTDGGGGTGTGLGMGVLSSLGLGTGIFAPGWSFEHFPDHGREVERAIWQGEDLPAGISCDCWPARPHTVPFKRNGVSQYARSSPAGTHTFFHTDFSRAFSRMSHGGIKAHLGSQSVQPEKMKAELLDIEGFPCGSLSARVSGSPSRCVCSVDLNRETTRSSQAHAIMRLFDLKIPAGQSRTISVRYRTFGSINCRVHLVIRQAEDDIYIELSHRGEASPSVARFLNLSAYPITGLELHLTCTDISSLVGRTDFAELFAITVAPYYTPEAKCEITNLRVEIRGDLDYTHRRLVWDISEDSSWQRYKDMGMPISDITGPCAYFIAHLGGKEIGRAYALEYVISEAEAESWKASRASNVQVTAIGVDGATLGNICAMLTWPAGDLDDWVLVFAVEPS